MPRRALVFLFFGCVEYPHYECYDYALQVGVDVPPDVACDIDIEGAPAAHIHADSVVVAPTFDTSPSYCTIPNDYPESFTCSSHDLTALSCNRTCTTLWVTSSDPSVNTRFRSIAHVHVACGATTEDFTREVVSATCPL